MFPGAGHSWQQHCTPFHHPPGMAQEQPVCCDTIKMWKLRAVQQGGEREDTCEIVFQQQREGPIITIFGHARSYLSPTQTAA